MIVAKLAGARSRIRARAGSCEGRKPFGVRNGEKWTIGRILSLRASGMAIDTIAETLNAEGIRPRSGKLWYGSSVRKRFSISNPQIVGFNGFPAIFVVTSRQI